VNWLKLGIARTQSKNYTSGRRSVGLFARDQGKVQQARELTSV
jgi:hypothetical protein